MDTLRHTPTTGLWRRRAIEDVGVMAVEKWKAGGEEEGGREGGREG